MGGRAGRRGGLGYLPPPERVDDASISSKAGYPATETDSVGGGAVQGARTALFHTRTRGPVSSK